MKKIFILLLLGAGVSAAAQTPFADCFFDKTMRFDYYHAGDSRSEEYFFDALKEEQRESLCTRYTLARSQRTVETEHGPVRVKEARGWGVTREKPEYEDVAKIAREQGLTLDQVKELLQ